MFKKEFNYISSITLILSLVGCGNQESNVDNGSQARIQVQWENCNENRPRSKAG